MFSELLLIPTILFNQPEKPVLLSPVTIEEQIPPADQTGEVLLAEHELDLTDRLPASWGNEVFRYNILLYTAYLNKLPRTEVRGIPKREKFVFRFHPLRFNRSGILVQNNFDRLPAPVDQSNLDNLESSFTLKPQETFAFHNLLLPDYESTEVKALPLQLKRQEGFKALAGPYC